MTSLKKHLKSLHACWGCIIWPIYRQSSFWYLLNRKNQAPKPQTVNGSTTHILYFCCFFQKNDGATLPCLLPQEAHQKASESCTKVETYWSLYLGLKGILTRQGCLILAVPFSLFFSFDKHKFAAFPLPDWLFTCLFYFFQTDDETSTCTTNILILSHIFEHLVPRMVRCWLSYQCMNLQP